MDQKKSDPNLMKKQILVIEDAPEYLQIIKASIGTQYDILSAQNGAEALRALQDNKVDLVLLDVVLPDMKGYQICSFIKSNPFLKDTPVIFLSGNELLEEKLEGFEHGGDDYVTKPFHHKELLARIAANLRKYSRDTSELLKLGDLKIDVQKQHVSRLSDPTGIDLTRIEFKLLVYFAKHPEWILSREQILEKVWPEKVNVSDRVIDSHLSNLRKKIKDSNVLIEAVHGSGYRLKFLTSQKIAA